MDARWKFTVIITESVQNEPFITKPRGEIFRLNFMAFLDSTLDRRLVKVLCSELKNQIPQRYLDKIVE